MAQNNQGNQQQQNGEGVRQTQARHQPVSQMQQDQEQQQPYGESALFEDPERQLPASTAQRKLVALEHFVSLLVQNIDFDHFAKEILVAMMTAVPTETSSFLEINPKIQSLFFRAMIGNQSDQLKHFLIPMGQGIVGQAVRARQLILVDDMAADQRHLKAIANTAGFEVRNCVALPVIVRGEVFAVIELMNRVGEAKFLAQDLEILTSLLRLSGEVIEARLMLSWVQSHAAVAGQDQEEEQVSGLSRRQAS